MATKENSKPKWCSLNIQKLSECMFEGICLAGGLCSFKKGMGPKNNFGSNSGSIRKLKKRSPENRFPPNKRKKKKKKK